jgi:hypothetical protein
VPSKGQEEPAAEEDDIAPKSRGKAVPEQAARKPGKSQKAKGLEPQQAPERIRRQHRRRRQQQRRQRTRDNNKQQHKTKTNF